MMHGMEGVRGSIPLSSTKVCPYQGLSMSNDTMQCHVNRRQVARRGDQRTPPNGETEDYGVEQKK